MATHPLNKENYPEDKADRARFDTMRIRPMKYGGYFTLNRGLACVVCEECEVEIIGGHLKVDGVHYHDACFVEKRKKK